MTTAPTAPGSTAVTLVIQTRVAPGHDDEYARWNDQVIAALTRFPGYLDHTIIPPNPPSQVDWVIAQRFDSAESARAWLQSDERLRLLDTIQPILVGQDDVHLFADGDGPKVAAPVTVIVSMRVKPGKEAAFQQWQRKIAAVEATFEGFSGYRLEPPVPGVQDDWVTMLRFNSDDHLDAWLNSDQRTKLLEETPDFSEEFHTRKVRTGFESWFDAPPGEPSPPAWKQNMVVLMLLYPIVFLFGFFVQTPFLIGRGMPFWLSLFFANAASTAILGFGATAWASRRLGWWLSPAPSAPGWTVWAGVGIIVAIYALSLLIFSQFPPTLLTP